MAGKTLNVKSIKNRSETAKKSVCANGHESKVRDMEKPAKKPRILVVTPEVTFLPPGMKKSWPAISARAGGLADISAALINALFKLNIDVHLAMPNYRNVFSCNAESNRDGDWTCRSDQMSAERIHLAQDRSFFYQPKLASDTSWNNIKIALAFHRDVLNRIIPEVRPNLIHCHDWMTGLIPAMTRRLGIPCLFTIYHLNNIKLPLSVIEDHGIDAALFWQNCFYSRMPENYEESRDTNPLDFLASGVFAAHQVNVVSPNFLREIIENRCHLVDPALADEVGEKCRAGCLSAIPNAPDPSYDPASDKALHRRYTYKNHRPSKQFNKLRLQEMLNLKVDSKAALFFWPTRLDSSRQSCRLLAEVLPIMIKHYGHTLQVVFVADGDFQDHLNATVHKHNAEDRVSLNDFDSKIYRLAYAASDFVLMPMFHEPCGLPCKIGHRYGSLPIIYDSGASHEIVKHLDSSADYGNGFVFKNFDVNGLIWAIDQAMVFHRENPKVRERQIKRIMSEAGQRYDYDHTAKQYIAIYEQMLQRPLRTDKF